MIGTESQADAVPPFELSTHLGLLREAPPRWRSFAGGFVFQTLLCGLLANFLFFEFVKDKQEARYQSTEVYTSSALIEVTAPKPNLNLQPPRVEAIQESLRTPDPQHSAEPLPPLELSQALPQSAPDIVLPKMRPALPRLRDEIRANVFPEPTSAATLQRSAAKVQTGGFGDPNGVPANSNAHGAVAIAQVGDFDLPGGPGVGNGTGGSRGAIGTIATATFESVVSVGHAGGSKGGSVRQGGFGELVADSKAQEPTPHSPSPLALVPAEIISKPLPAYTPEARQKHIEGEVLVDVILGADGHVRVLRVVQGLGHGLDESAVRAAEKVVFKPAQRGGQSVDSTARIHITFQLA